MTTPKSVKIASIVSLISIAVWLLAVTAIDVFQENLITLFYPGTTFAEDTEHIFLASTLVHIMSAAVIAACNILMLNGKTTLIPLICSGAAALLNPIVADLAHRLQMVLTGNMQGSYYLQKLAATASFTSFASYILNAAFLCTAAASAVYAYAKKKGQNNENPENS